MSKARPLPLPPSGISVWRPLSSSEGGLVAILGSGPSEGEDTSDKDVQCVWCGLRSLPAAACDVCGSPLYESITIWQPDSTTRVEEPPAPVPTQAPQPAPLPSEPATPPAPMTWAVTSNAATPAEPPSDNAFKAFKRFAGLEIHWIRRSGE
jgi:hypothetical protein